MGLDEQARQLADGAGGVHEAAGHQALRRGAPRREARGLGGHLPQQGHRGDRAPRARSSRHRLRTRAWRARSAASRSASGSTDMANAWLTRDVRVTVPETARFDLHGTLRPGVRAKDVMLHLLRQPFFKSGEGIGKVLEFAGEGVARHAARRARDADEHGGRGGRLHRDHRGRRGGRRLPREAARRSTRTTCGARIVQRRPGRDVLRDVRRSTSAPIVPMVATPGDPRNGVPLDAASSAAAT